MWRCLEMKEMQFPQKRSPEKRTNGGQTKMQPGRGPNPNPNGRLFTLLKKTRILRRFHFLPPFVQLKK